MTEVTHALDLIRRRAQLPPAELRLLVYVVDETLAGRAAALNQKTIAADVFGCDLGTFDGHENSVVRTTAGKLRDGFFHYYAGPGQSDPLMIEIPKGSYVPRFTLRPRLSPEANGRLWRARLAMEERTVSGFRTAIDLLDSVIAESPALSLPLGLKAEALASQAIHGARPRPNLERARDLAELALGQPLPAWQAWLAKGMVRQALDWKWKQAGACYGKAIELSGGEAATNPWYAAFLVGRGRPLEGAAHLRRAVDHIGYIHPTCVGDLSMALILARDYDAARVVIQSALEAAPGYYQHHLNRAILLEALGDPAGAVRVLDQTPLHILERPVTWGLRALFAGLSGNRSVARRRAAWLKAAAKTGKYVPHSQIAACWIGAGDPGEAVRSLERAAEDRDPLAVWFYAYPMTRHLQGNDGFEKLIEAIGVVRY